MQWWVRRMVKVLWNGDWLEDTDADQRDYEYRDELETRKELLAESMSVLTNANGTS